MDPIQTLASTLSLGFLAGFRLYLTLFALGLGVRLHWFVLPPQMAHLAVLAETWVLATTAVCGLIEFFADKVPWVDSTWDTIHTVVRPVGAALLGASAFGNANPAAQMIVALLCGGVALTGHSSKAAARLLVNHSPEPFSNIGISLAEDAGVGLGFWLWMHHPLVLEVAAGLFLLAVLWLAPKVYRLLSLEFVAVAALFRKYFSEKSRTPLHLPAEFEPLFQNPTVANALRNRLEPLPGDFQSALLPAYQLQTAPPAVPCAAIKGFSAPHHSLGYLCFVNGDLLFVNKQRFRYRMHRIAMDPSTRVDFRSGLLVDRIRFMGPLESQSFDLFKVGEADSEPTPAKLSLTHE